MAVPSWGGRRRQSDRGLAMMKEDFEQGRSLQLVSLDEIPDDAIVASPYGCGAPSASSNPEDRFQGLPA